jgi:hypothetical protein
VVELADPLAVALVLAGEEIDRHLLLALDDCGSPRVCPRAPSAPAANASSTSGATPATSRRGSAFAV